MLQRPPKLTPSDAKIGCMTPKMTPVTPKMHGDLSPPAMSVCIMFQVDSCNSVGVMLQKTNLTFVTSVTLKTKVTTQKQIAFLRGLWGSYIPGFNLIAVQLLELLRRNGRDPKLTL